LNVNVQPVWIPVRDNKRHQSLWTNNKDCSKGEGPIRNEDPCEKEDCNNRASARGLISKATNSTGVFRTMTSKTAVKERDRSETESRGAKTAKKSKHT